MKKIQQTWTVWLHTTRKLLTQHALPKDNAHLKRFFDNGDSPLETMEFLLRKEADRKNETVEYSDGTIATGPAPLPLLSPRQQDAATA